MFTGIIETQGRIERVEEQGTGKTFWISSVLTVELKTDQSLAHDGVCLTVEETINDQYRVTAIWETLRKTNLNLWKSGDLVNLERCVKLNGRLDGHIVQGHVDTTASCIHIEEREGSTEFRFQFDPGFAPLVIEKGSICLNGISLTLFNVLDNSFDVAIIPYTSAHTNMSAITISSTVNIEFDIIGKYINRMVKTTGQ